MSWSLAMKMFCWLLLPFLLLSPSAQGGNTCCSDGWMPYKGSCYYFDVSISRNWINAKVWCDQHSANLAVIETARESRFLQEFANRLFKNHTVKAKSAFWLGATDDENEGTWKWYTTDEEVTYFDWDNSQPNGNFSNQEDCLALNGAYSFRWHDGNCGNSLAYPLCEKTAAGSSGGGGLIG